MCALLKTMLNHKINRSCKLSNTVEKDSFVMNYIIMNVINQVADKLHVWH